MKKILLLFALLATAAFTACSDDNNNADTTPPPTPTDSTGDNGRTLVAYFSWSGNTQAVAEEIARLTGGTLFRIEPSTPYPTDYTACTEVALEERDTDARPVISGSVENMADYDTVFIGGPVWWHTAPMILHTFTESYDFTGKTVIPFCTYASTYRDETLACLVELTPTARHLEGFGAQGGNTSGVETWLRRIGVIGEE